jgi:hypothetical protein
MSTRYTVPAAWRTPAPAPPPSTLGQQDAILRELARLGWSAERKAAYLTDRFSCTHAVQLDTCQAAAFLTYLRGLHP